MYLMRDCCLLTFFPSMLEMEPGALCLLGSTLPLTCVLSPVLTFFSPSFKYLYFGDVQYFFAGGAEFILGL